MIVILLGKSASGKDTIARKLVKARPADFFTKLVGTTSRPIRENEKMELIITSYPKMNFRNL